jgi:AmmeMemoRadiSam system protein B
MTHYGTRFGFCPHGLGKPSLQWVKQENDRKMIELMTGLAEDKVVDEAMENQNACGSGAIAATLAFAKEKGKSKGVLLDYTTSWDVFPEREIDNFVGYSAVVF